MQTFKWRKDFGLIFPALSNMTNVRKHFLRVKSYSVLYCGTYRSILLGPKRLLRTQIFEKKAKLPVRKKFWPMFSPIIGHDKCQWALYKRPIKIWEKRGRYEQTSEKKFVFAVTIIFGPFFLVFSSVTELKEHFKRV